MRSYAVAAMSYALRTFVVLGLASAHAALAQDPVRIGVGDHTYEWVAGFGARPDGSDLGNTHGQIAVDREGRIYFNTDTKDAVMVYSPAGELLSTWGTEFAGGMHGMSLAT